jgi:hypothetical protein
MNPSKIVTSDITKLRTILDKYGVGILENYFDDTYADEVFGLVKKWLIGLDIGLTNDVATWINKNLPWGPRYGMYQSIISNAPKFWELREKFYPLFQEILGEPELLASVDGASFFPTANCPKNKADWAHIDQTIGSDFMCYQSQFVATNTLASFVCTPKSHKLHKTLLKKFSIKSNNNWHKFTDGEVAQLKSIFKDNYQIPIHAKKGSVIFWDSRTIHSAKYPDVKENGWRAVFYISMRPFKSFDLHNIKTIQLAITSGKTTNHWGSTIFKPKDRFRTKNPLISALMTNSKIISYYPYMTTLQKKLYNFDSTDCDVIKGQCIFLLDKCLKENVVDVVLYDRIKNFIVANNNMHTIRKIIRLLITQYCTEQDMTNKLKNMIKQNNEPYVEV